MTFWVDEETENFPPEGTSENPVEPTRCLAQPGKSKAPKTRAARKVRMTSSRIRHPFQVNSQLVTCRGLFKRTDAQDSTVFQSIMPQSVTHHTGFLVYQSPPFTEVLVVTPSNLLSKSDMNAPPAWNPWLHPRHDSVAALRAPKSSRQFFTLKILAAIAFATFAVMEGFAAGSLTEVTVFQSGTEGYRNFRVPAIVRTTNGTLLAFAEGRKNSSSDTGDIDLVLKRSFDNGHTWRELQVIGDDGPNTFGNPVPIVDATTGRILLLTTHNAGNVTEAQVMKGAVQDRRVFVQASADDGASWSAAQEITAAVKRANWRGYATGPGHGIQLTRGPHAGRLIAACDHTMINSTGGWSACGAHLLYSDNGGNTWRIGADDSPGTGLINPNESTVVELTDGRIYTLARNQEGRAVEHRAFAYSSDGGVSFDEPFAVTPGLVSPVVEAALLRWSALDQGGTTNRVLLSAPGDATARKNMTVRSSFDETRTWNVGKVIHVGPAAYSDLAKLPGERIGVLYESGILQPYERIAFTVFDVPWLDAP
jgi:hypothetical protein